MAEIRCPMCGKPNPDHLEVCQFCQARLKPLIASSSSDDRTPPFQNSDKASRELPEWSSSIWDDGTDDSEPEDDLFSEDDADALEWLNRIRDESEPEGVHSPQNESGAPFEGESSSPAENDDWLQRIRALQQEDQQAEQESLDSPPEEESPLAFSFDDALDKERLDADENGIPDWLISFHDEDESTPGDVDEPEGEGLPDWLGGSLDDETPNALTPAAEAELPDWLSSLGEQPPPTDELEAAPSTSSPELEIPDWLSDLGTNNEPIPPAAEDEVPDWLSTSDQDQPEASQATPISEAETPDWFSDLGVSEEPALAGDNDLPDWLSDVGVDEAPLGEPESAVSVSPEGEAISDRLSETGDDDFTTIEAMPGEAEQPPSVDEGEDMPGWLQKLGTVVTGTVEDDSVADTLAEPVAPFVVEENFDEALLDVDGLPDWLSGESDTTGASEGIDDSGLTPAELPGWLEAMRPVDSGGPEATLDDDQVESTGPLVGLHNVLSAEPEIAATQKPPLYSTKLQVTANQQAQATLFENLLGTEGDAAPVSHPPRLSSQRVLRWLIALVLGIVVGFVVISGSQKVPMPNLTAIPAAASATSKLVSALPDQAPVLLAFDYEPGMAGEMNVAAAALVDHLMLKGARLTLVSTSPTGPAMAEYFIKNVQARHGYSSGLQYINLGYIPGGAAGLRSFAQTPRLVISLSFDGLEPWETPPLQGVETVSDFALLVVITEDPETARAWIEQVQPKLGSTPLVTVLSAQAEPMVRPYFGNDPGSQVQGMVNGLMGGAAYEVAVGQNNLGRAYWDAFSVGLIIAVGAILIGGMVNVVSSLLARGKEKQGQAA